MTLADPERLRSQVLECLAMVEDPCSIVNDTPMSLVDMGLVQSVIVEPNGDIDICLRLTSPFCEMLGYMRRAAIEEISALDGAARITIRTDSGLDWSPEMMSPAARRRRQERLSMLRGLGPV